MNTKLLMIYFLNASSVYKLIKRTTVRMALRVKALAAIPVDLSPIPGTHVVEEEKTDSRKLCSDVCV